MDERSQPADQPADNPTDAPAARTDPSEPAPAEMTAAQPATEEPVANERDLIRPAEQEQVPFERGEVQELIEPDTAAEAEPVDTVPPGGRRPDGATLLVGVLTLAMAVAAFVGAVPDLSGFDPRWLLAVGTSLIGAFLLVNGIRNRTRPH